MKKYKSIIFICTLITLVVALIYLVMIDKTISLDINMDFSIYPSNYKNAFVLTGNVLEPVGDIDKLREAVNLTNEHEIPYTLFSTVDVDSDYKSVISKKPNINLTYYDVELGGYLLDYKSIPYTYQEILIRQQYKAYKEKGVNAKGFRPAMLSYSYDTILAAENSMFEFVSPGFSNEYTPFHPKNPLNYDMSIIVFPISVYDDSVLINQKGMTETEVISYWFDAYNENKANEGVFTLMVDPMFISSNKEMFDLFFNKLKEDNNTWFVSMQELNDYIRKTENIQARITTDYKNKISNIEFIDLFNDTKINVRTEMIPLNVTKKEGNETILIEFEKTPFGLSLILDESDDKIFVNWELPK